MYDQKLENLLNLSLSVTQEERMQSQELSAGFDEQEDVWTLILKYHGDIDTIRDKVITAIPLYGGYAVVRVKEGDIETLAGFEPVEYIEKPKMLYFEFFSQNCQKIQ